MTLPPSGVTTRLQGMFSEEKISQLLATGVLNIQSLGDAIQKQGDTVNIPQAIQVDDLQTVDLTSTSAYTGTRATTVNAKTPILRHFTAMSFTESDDIRTQENWREKFAASAGNKVAKDAIVSLNAMLQGVINVSGLNHLLDYRSHVGATGTSGITGKNGSLTIDALRKAKALLSDQGNHVDTMLIHPSVYADLWADILSTYHFGGSLASEWIQNSQMEAMFGIKNVIVSADVTPVASSGSTTADFYNYYTWLFKSQTTEVDKGNGGPIYYGYQAMPRYAEFVDSRVPSTLFQPKWNVDFALGVRGVAYTGASTAVTINPSATDLATALNYSLATSDTRNIGVLGIESFGGII